MYKPLNPATLSNSSACLKIGLAYKGLVYTGPSNLYHSYYTLSYHVSPWVEFQEIHDQVIITYLTCTNGFVKSDNSMKC